MKPQPGTGVLRVATDHAPICTRCQLQPCIKKPSGEYGAICAACFMRALETLFAETEANQKAAGEGG